MKKKKNTFIVSYDCSIERNNSYIMFKFCVKDKQTHHGHRESLRCVISSQQ